MEMQQKEENRDYVRAMLYCQTKMNAHNVTVEDLPFSHLVIAHFTELLGYQINRLIRDLDLKYVCYTLSAVGNSVRLQIAFQKTRIEIEKSIQLLFKTEANT
jgi:hypothetical protein